MKSTEQLAQLLLPAKYAKEQLRQALERADHDVTRAAEILLLGIGSSKRKDLGGWLKPQPEGIKKKRKRSSGSSARSGALKSSDDTTTHGVEDLIVLSSDDEEDCIVLGEEKRPNKVPTSPQKSVPQSGKVLSLATLQQAPSPVKRNIARPPVVLTTASAISSTLPCSFVPSPLSAEFATALYLSLVKESQTEEIISEDAEGNKAITQAGFRRHKWFLNGREVVSPHTSGYYRLSESQGGVGKGGEYCERDAFRSVWSSSS